eukprot:CAMPEP_0183705892 /NCGR_PEP_ID=MMETSP0737-20130205/2863_1 /TAXON_ID=385413 /ORGANISM="Thalassiosira miniscula, Strain CCMP1093" /LENGTH=609 /DNA_ID=CAMNT_0025933155 /DNA_START=257 /DNA_END=2086 /DNA_ORIENTATION=+
MSEITDDAISQFLAFSGSGDPSVARQYLEMSGNNLETAVSLYMDHGAGGGGGGSSAGGLGGGSSSAAGGGGGGGMDPFLGGGGGEQQVRAPDATRSMRLLGGDSPSSSGRIGGGSGIGGLRLQGRMEMEPNASLMAALGGPAAREMMANMMAAENGGGDVDAAAMFGSMASTWAAADGVNGAFGASASANAGGRRGSGSRRSRSGSSSSAGNANARRRNNSNNNSDDDDDDVQVVNPDGQAMDVEEGDDDYNYNYNSGSDDSHDLGGSASNAARNVNSQPPSLSTMFAQPTHLMHRAGGFMGAKNFAKDARRWLLVNIQSDDDFACHALNRDVWRDELVENLVREGFILFQAMSTSNEGQTYITRYKVTGYPHLAIIDPRTGSLLWRKEGWTQVNPLTAEQFVEIASDFCSRHSFDKLPTAARHAYANGVPLGAASSSNDSGSRPAANGNNKRPIHELTEEEQLQAAIRASMQEDADGGDNDDGDSNENETSNDDANENDDESKPSAFEQEILAMEVGDEPTSGSIARVQIRMPDGKRIVRKFSGDKPVKMIYAFVAQQQQKQANEDEDKTVKAFELKAKFPPQDLFASIDDSISTCGLNGEAINVFWK